MEKRKRCYEYVRDQDQDQDQEQQNVKRPYLPPSSPRATASRKSSRSQAKQEDTYNQEQALHFRSSPEAGGSQHSKKSPIQSDSTIPGDKVRKRRNSCTSIEEYRIAHTKIVSNRNAELTANEWVALWTYNLRQILKRKNASMAENAKRRRTPSSHRADEVNILEESNIVTVPENTMPENNMTLFAELLQGHSSPTIYPSYPADRCGDVLNRIIFSSEEKVKRDVGQIVVPSAENLVLCGESGLENICEEPGAEWSRCAKICHKRSKPDFTAGLNRSAFSPGMYDKLIRYSTIVNPVHFTPEICFPFLTAEIKCGNTGLTNALLQNTRHGAAAVRALINLHWAAYGQEDERSTNLYLKPLFFSISHNHEYVEIYAHFAKLEEGTKDKLKFCHFKIKGYNLRDDNGRERFGCYNFVRNVYKSFVPMHLKRIDDAARDLRERQVLSRRYSVTSSTNSQTEIYSTQESRTTELDADGFVQPDLPYSSSLLQEVANLRERMQDLSDKAEAQAEKLRQQLEQQQLESNRREEAQAEKLRQQLEQQRLESNRREEEQAEKLRQQLEQQRLESNRREEEQAEKLRQQLEQQRLESNRREEEQRDQINRLIDLLANRGSTTANTGQH